MTPEELLEEFKKQWPHLEFSLVYDNYIPVIQVKIPEYRMELRMLNKESSILNLSPDIVIDLVKANNLVKESLERK